MYVHKFLQLYLPIVINPEDIFYCKVYHWIYANQLKETKVSISAGAPKFDFGGYHWLPSKSDFGPQADGDFSLSQLVGINSVIYFVNLRPCTCLCATKLSPIIFSSPSSVEHNVMLSFNCSCKDVLMCQCPEEMKCDVVLTDFDSIVSRTNACQNKGCRHVAGTHGYRPPEVSMCSH